MDNSNRQDDEKPTTESDVAATSLLNQFILGQLKENQSSNGVNGLRNGFVLPKLQFGSPKAGQFVIPPLKLSHPNNTPMCNAELSQLVITQAPKTKQILNENIVEISNGVNNLQVNDALLERTKVETSKHTIDLTAALSTTAGFIVQNKRTTSVAVEDFQIPFIECDRQEKSLLLPVIENYSQRIADANAVYKGKLVSTPSSCGRIICLKYKHKRALPKICHSFKVKHKIQRFRFDSKSPDDLVLATLSKYHRQY
uniref:Uncharacterized protein n=1 Tax=Ceratitis capitata TaxID=7213 RepID=W8C2U0_CERCA